MRFIILLCLYAAMPITSMAAIVCVGPSATGSGSGNDWNNQAVWSSVTLTRGNTYYLADGTYGGRTLSTANSGTTLITILKAIESDHGTATGWTSTFGDGQASFTGPININSSYWTIDGQTGGGAANGWSGGFGIKITVTADVDALIEIGRPGSGSAGNNVTLRHIDFQGKGSVSTDGGGDSNDGLSLWYGANVTLSYFHMHGIGRCPFFVDPSNLIVEHGWVESYFASGSVHSEVMSTGAFGQAIGDITFRYCMVTHLSGTGGIMWDNNENTSAVCAVYGCVWFKDASGDAWDEQNGVLGGWTGASAEECRNFLAYNNTFILIDQSIFSTFPLIHSNDQAKNNLLYTCDSPSFSVFDTHDFNHFIASGGAHSEGNGTSAASGNPFVDYPNFNFRLNANTTAGTDLGAPYNVDMLGNTRTTWTRGAIEFVSGGGSAGTRGTASGRATISGRAKLLTQ